MANSDNDSSDESNEIVAKEIREAAQQIALNLLPDKSKRLYTIAYNGFKKWRRDHKTNSFCEDVMLAYFDELSKKYASTSLWSTYSMLKTTINAYDDIDISKYTKLINYLKKQSRGYIPKKSAVFEKEHISKFLSEAPDSEYLSEKVALIFSIAGALRRGEFVELTMENVKQLEDALVVNIIKTKNHVPRSFTITGALYDICMKYISTRPTNCKSDRFFLKYFKGCCTNQVIGINKIGSMPKDIATYLELPNAKLYTGHSFRRSSATLLVDAGADLLTLQRHGGWKSGNVAYGYITNSMANKKRIFNQISSGIVLSDKSKKPSDVQPDKENLPSNSKIMERPATEPVQDPTSGTEIPLKVRRLQETISIEQNRVHHSRIDSAKTDSNDEVAIRNQTHRVPSHKSAINGSSKSDSNNGITCNGTVHIQSCVPRSQVLYHPDIGLYIPDLADENSSKVLIFNNCTVTIDGSYSTLVCNKSEKENKSVQTE